MARTKAKMAIVVGIGILLAAGMTTVVVVKTHTATNQVDPVGATRARPQGRGKQVLAIRDSLFPAFMQFAEAHGDQLPTSLVDLKPYFSGNSTDMDDDHWQIKAQGKMTPLLSTKNVILAEQKNVPFDEPRLIIYTDGHVERKK